MIKVICTQTLYNKDRDIILLKKDKNYYMSVFDNCVYFHNDTAPHEIIAYFPYETADAYELTIYDIENNYITLGELRNQQIDSILDD